MELSGSWYCEYTGNVTVRLTKGMRVRAMKGQWLYLTSEACFWPV